MMFYERPVPLDRDSHARLRVRGGGFGHAARTNSSPLLGAEIVPASRSFPILFVDIGGGQLFPIALLGLRAGQNLFVDADGGWEDGRHIPAFVRRYPFVLSGDMTVCIDEHFPGFSTESGEPLFLPDGTNTPLLDHAISFLQGFHEAVAQTDAFVARLNDLDLLMPVTLNVVPEAGEPYRLDGLRMVDGERLGALDGAAVLRLFRAGEMAWIHAHLASLAGIEDLNRRSNARARVAPSTTDTLTEAAAATDAAKED